MNMNKSFGLRFLRRRDGTQGGDGVRTATAAQVRRRRGRRRRLAAAAAWPASSAYRPLPPARADPPECNDVNNVVFETTQDVTLEVTPADATIWYTTDGNLVVEEGAGGAGGDDGLSDTAQEYDGTPLTLMRTRF